MVYELAQELFLIEELRLSHHLPSTVPYNELLAERKRKRSEINMDFYTTEAMINRDWKTPTSHNSTCSLASPCTVFTTRFVWKRVFIEQMRIACAHCMDANATNTTRKLAQEWQRVSLHTAEKTSYKHLMHICARFYFIITKNHVIHCLHVHAPWGCGQVFPSDHGISWFGPTHANDRATPNWIQL